MQNDLFSLKNKVILITGSGRGIGEFLAENIVKEGAIVYRIDNKFSKKCPLSIKNAPVIDYKNVNLLKKYVTDNAFNIANNSLQLLGGYGYLTDYGIEKIVRDLRVHQILEGTNEIMQLIIARRILN